MVVDDLDFLGPNFRPSEADAVLVVDSDRVLPCSITSQLLEPKPGKREGLKGDSRVQPIQRGPGLLMKNSTRFQMSFFV